MTLKPVGTEFWVTFPILPTDPGREVRHLLRVVGYIPGEYPIADGIAYGIEKTRLIRKEIRTVSYGE